MKRQQRLDWDGILLGTGLVVFSGFLSIGMLVLGIMGAVSGTVSGSILGLFLLLIGTWLGVISVRVAYKTVREIQGKD